MTDRYVGIGGNDGNSGLTWALRKLTLNGAEDTPVVAGDTVYIGPGVYREMLTVDVSGAGGTPITYIADVTGENTDDVGGIVRITGSDNDQTTARNIGITATGKDYRTFRGFLIDMTSAIYADGCTNWIVEDCVLSDSRQGGNEGIYIVGADQADWIIRRCLFINTDYGDLIISMSHDATVDDVGHLIENCVFASMQSQAIAITRIGGITIKNCSFFGCERSVRIFTDPAGGQTIDVNNCIFQGNNQACYEPTGGFIIEDYNTFFGNGADRVNTGIGGNSVTYPSLCVPPILFDGIKYPWWYSELNEWSQVIRITGTGEASEDMRGIPRPATASKNSWGAVQFQDMERETGTVRTGSVSMVLHDAGRHQIWVPVTSTSTTISVYVYREANYAGNNPQMIIKQPGQADDVTTDAGAAANWNLLTTTFTPAADPPYVVVELVSRNTAVALAFNVFFDDLDVS